MDRWVVEIICTDCLYCVVEHNQLKCSHPQRKSDLGDGITNLTLSPDDVQMGCSEGEHIGDNNDAS